MQGQRRFAYERRQGDAISVHHQNAALRRRGFVAHAGTPAVEPPAGSRTGSLQLYPFAFLEAPEAAAVLAEERRGRRARGQHYLALAEHVHFQHVVAGRAGHGAARFGGIAGGVRRPVDQRVFARRVAHLALDRRLYRAVDLILRDGTGLQVRLIALDLHGRKTTQRDGRGHVVHHAHRAFGPADVASGIRCGVDERVFAEIGHHLAARRHFQSTIVLVSRRCARVGEGALVGYGHHGVAIQRHHWRHVVHHRHIVHRWCVVAGIRIATEKPKRQQQDTDGRTYPFRSAAALPQLLRNDVPQS